MIRGWCPGLFTPMPSGDGMLVRVAASRGLLTADQARRIAHAAFRHGNGRVELTNRGKLQIRGLTALSAAAFAAEMRDAGLGGGAGAPDLIASPLAGLDPGVRPGTIALAEAIAHSLSGLSLPGKFLIALDGGGALPLAIRADITIRAAGPAWLVALDGAPEAARCDAITARDIVHRLARAFAASFARRMSDIDAATIFAAAGVAPNASMPGIAAPDPIGDFPTIGCFGLAPPFGQMDLMRLAQLAERHGDATIRLTPWRACLLRGRLPPAAETAGFITDPNDPRRAIVACTGQPGCASASVDTHAAAARLAAARLTALGVPGPIHVSGCAKGCAHPAAAPITLVGAGGRFGLIRDGRAGDPPAAMLDIDQAIAILAAA